MQFTFLGRLGRFGGGVRRRAVPVLLALGVAALLALGSATAWTGARPRPAEAAPSLLGSKPWAVALCEFTEQPNTGEPEPASWFQNFITQSAPNHDGLWDYWNDVSYGQMSLNGSKIYGWNSMPQPLSYYSQWNNNTNPTRRQKLWQDCAQTAVKANPSVDFTQFYGILSLLNTQKAAESGAVATGPLSVTLNGKSGSWGAVVLDPGAWSVSFAAHEMGHAFGLNHTYDTASCDFSGPPTGQYCDPYDIMSFANVYDFTGTEGLKDGLSGTVAAGPGLVAPNLDQLGWIPAMDISNVNPASGPIGVWLSPLEEKSTQLPGQIFGQVLMAKVPIDSAQHYYTVEYRVPGSAFAGGTEWDQAIPKAAILIHEVQFGLATGPYFLVDTNGGPSWQPGQSFVGQKNIRITVSGSAMFGGMAVCIDQTTDGLAPGAGCTAPAGGGSGGGGPAGGGSCPPTGGLVHNCWSFPQPRPFPMPHIQ